MQARTIRRIHVPLLSSLKSSMCLHTPLISAQVSQQWYTRWHKAHTVGLAFHAPRVFGSARRFYGHGYLSCASACAPESSICRHTTQKRTSVSMLVHTLAQSNHCRACHPCSASLRLSAPVTATSAVPAHAPILYAVRQAQKSTYRCSNGASDPCSLRVRRCAALAPGRLPTSCCLVGSRSCTCTPCSKSQWVCAA